ncbi:globin-like protein [Kockiozyma suomiensis]|uniref:globin-like protein n=1 Tax=Kockiozyma suomiensis TaxID=1337062 RepID=UPI0033440B30
MSFFKKLASKSKARPQPTTPVQRPLSFTTTSTTSPVTPITPASARIPPSPAMSQTSSVASGAYSERSNSTGYSSIPEEPGSEKDPNSSLSFHEITIELTEDDVAAVRETYNETIGLSPSNNAGSSLGSPANLFFSQFYQNLFALRPDLEFMFPDIQRQSAALSGIFSAALAMLDNIHALDDVLERLGRRHSYIMGVEPEHFEFVGVIFIQTLRDRLGARFAPNVEITWVKIYSYLAAKMIAAGNDNSPSSSSSSSSPQQPLVKPKQLQVPPPPEKPFFPTKECNGLLVPDAPINALSPRAPQQNQRAQLQPADKFRQHQHLTKLQPPAQIRDNSSHNRSGYAHPPATAAVSLTATRKRGDNGEKCVVM